MSSKNNEVSLRLKKIRESTGMSQASFAQLFDLPQSTYAKYERGASISDSVLMGLALKGYDLNWLLTGISNKTTNRNTNKETKNIEIDIPIIASKVSAGFGEEWRDDDFLEGQMVPITKDLIKGHDIKKIFAAQVKGDSMYPKFLDGDRVLVARTSSVDSGAIAVILYNQTEATLKKVGYVYGEEWLNLIPLNTNYPPLRIEGADLANCKVLGKVVYLFRSIRGGIR